MENYYKILQVDRDASQEIIEKAYKTLVKKYHPDIQTDSNKKEAEDKIKKINEAYDILSDSIKRENYNKELNDNLVSVEEYNLIVAENNKLKNELNLIKNKINNYANYNSTYNTTRANNNYYSNANTTNNQYYRNYNINPNNLNYNINKNNFSFKNLLKFIFSIFLTGFIIFLILHLPFFYEIFLFLFDGNFPLLFIVVLFILFYIYKSR